MTITIGFDIGIKNLAVCALEQKADDAARIIAWRLLPLMPEERKTKPPQEQLMSALFNHLDELMEEVGSDDIVVVIENQPSRINGVMKTVQTWTQAYFYLRKHYGEPITGVHLVSASQKLLNHTHEPEGAKGEVNSYKYNKSAATVLTKLYLTEENSAWMRYFAESKKKDDLADSFLHAVAWMRRQGTMIARAGA